MTHPRPTSSSSWLPLLLLSLALTACTAPGSEVQEPSLSGRALLQRSAEAMRATRTVSHNFTYGGPQEPTGWVRGTTWMAQPPAGEEPWIRVEGVRHAQPRFEVDELRFTYGTDGRRARFVDHTHRTVETAPVGAGARRLSWAAVYGYLPELVEARPLWKELGEDARVEALEPMEVDGEVCDRVRVVFEPRAGAGARAGMDLRWSLARSDHLPRRARWISDLSAPGGLVFELTDLETGVDLPREDFLPPVPEGYEVLEPRPTPAVGEPAPDFDLATLDGERVTLESLRGQVVVLDFWNTWCFICRHLAPRTRSLAEQLSTEPNVRFFGVNLFETGDPAAYWRDGGFPYPTLLEGEGLARALDLPWQPGIAVIGPDGRVLFTELGGRAGRAERVRRAVGSATPTPPTQAAPPTLPGGPAGLPHRVWRRQPSSD